MGIRISFKDVPDSQDYSLLPFNKYPVRMKVDAYQSDQQGNFMLDGEGQKTYWKTQNGDPKWNIELEILDGPHAGRKILDNLNFSAGGLKRVKVLYVRGGFGESDDEIDLEAEDFDGTFWIVDVDKHEVAVAAGGVVKESKYTFKNKGCSCETCKANDGKNVNVNAKIGFAGFEPMPAAQAAKYQQPKAAGAVVDGTPVCAACNKGDHSHKLGVGCPCQVTDHPPF